MPTWFAVHLAAMVALHLWWPLYQWNYGMTRWWGLPFALVGLVLVVRSARRFAPITTLRPSETPVVLVTDGFYRRTRNPMYLGMAVSMVGGFVMLGSASPGLALPLFVWWVDTRFIAHEEHALEQQFGAAYREYKARVRRWL